MDDRINFIEIFPQSASCGMDCVGCNMSAKTIPLSNSMDARVTDTFQLLQEVLNKNTIPWHLIYGYPLSGVINEPLDIMNSINIRSIALSFGKITQDHIDNTASVIKETFQKMNTLLQNVDI